MAQKFKQRPVKPDPLYENTTVTKFVNQVMRRGKKTIARKIVYGAFEIIKKQTKKDPVEVFEKALNNVGPYVEVRPKRIGGATYQVPREVREKRRVSLAMRWIIEGARAKKGKAIAEKLAQEIMQAANNEGEAIRKKINTQRMAEANRAFAYLAR